MRSFDALDNWHEEFLKQVHDAFLIPLFQVLSQTLERVIQYYVFHVDLDADAQPFSPEQKKRIQEAMASKPAPSEDNLELKRA